jgi:hypothetical protein
MLLHFATRRRVDLLSDRPHLARLPIYTTNGGPMKALAVMSRIVCLLLICTGPAWSQSFTAAVRGVVTDPTGAAVSNAKVVITQADRNVQHTTTTDAEGRYSVSALQPGQYILTVEATGFKRYLQNAFPPGGSAASNDRRSVTTGRGVVSRRG